MFNQHLMSRLYAPGDESLEAAVAHGCALLTSVFNGVNHFGYTVWCNHWPVMQDCCAALEGGNQMQLLRAVHALRDRIHALREFEPYRDIPDIERLTVEHVLYLIDRHCMESAEAASLARNAR